MKLMKANWVWSSFGLRNSQKHRPVMVTEEQKLSEGLFDGNVYRIISYLGMLSINLEPMKVLLKILLTAVDHIQANILKINYYEISVVCFYSLNTDPKTFSIIPIAH